MSGRNISQKQKITEAEFYNRQWQQLFRTAKCKGQQILQFFFYTSHLYHKKNLIFGTQKNTNTKVFISLKDLT